MVTRGDDQGHVVMHKATETASAIQNFLGVQWLTYM